MPGSALNIDYPVQGDSFVVVLAKLVAAITAIVADIEPRVTAGELDIDTELSMNGAPLTNVGGVRLQNGGSNVVGTLYMDEELHAVTTAGDVQITLGGNLNIAALGTIGGDYGGLNPAAVNYVDIGGYYTFEESAGTFADISVDDVILNGSAGTVRIGVASAIAGDTDVIFKSFPVSMGMLAFNPADGTLVDAAGESVIIGGATFQDDVDVGTHKVKHAGRTTKTSFNLQQDVVKNTATVNTLGTKSGISVTPAGANVEVWLRLLPLQPNERLTKVEVTGSNSLAANLMALYSVGATGNWTIVPLLGPDTVAAVGNVYTLTVDTPTADRNYILGFAANTGATELYGADLTSDLA